MAAEVQVVEKILDATDRCDKCGSQAYFAVLFSYGELHFCRHHYMKHETMLKDEATDIIDQSGDLHRRQETGAYPDLGDG